MAKKIKKTHQQNLYIVNESKMLEEIRKFLFLTIKDFVKQMDWPNTKYYDYIKNGRKRVGQKIKKNAHPTIHKVFVGINYAIRNYNNWENNKKAIIKIVIKHLFIK